jgi:hypothetical protein
MSELNLAICDTFLNTLPNKETAISFNSFLNIFKTMDAVI